jgi:DNA primase large subunit
MLSNQQKLFLDQLSDLGDRDLAINRSGIDIPTFIQWLKVFDFKLAVEETEKYYQENLRVKIEQSALKSLDFILRNGSTVVTHTKTIDEVYGQVPIGETDRGVPIYESQKVGTKVKQVEQKKRERIVPWAVKEGIKLLLIRKAENDILNSIQQLSAQGLLPQQSEQVISGYMQEFRERVSQVLSGDYEKLEITDEILAQIQQAVISG